VKAKDIIQVSAYYPPHLGGQENAVYDLSQQLAANGHRVQVLTSTAGGSIAGPKKEGNVLVNRMRGLIFGHAPIMPSFPAELFRAATTNSVVHLHIGQAFTPEMVWLVSKLRRFKYIAELHIDFEPSGPAGVLLPLYKRVLLRRVLHSAASVITLNEKTLRTVRETYGYTGRAEVMHNGIDESYFAIERPAFNPQPPDILRLLFVGRLSKQKNLPTLIKALKMTSRNVYLDLLGDGEERDSVKKAIAEQGLTNVTMHGRQGREEVMKYYRSCDALIMPSLYEAQPLVLLEAMAARIPIIGTNVIGVEDHIKGAGIVVEPTAEGLAGGIEQYYQRYPLLQNMIERGYAIADKFRWRNALKEYEGLYEAVVGN
jgi:glycosyltransferase involved in cell wall biosynthesis